MKKLLLTLILTLTFLLISCHSKEKGTSTLSNTSITKSSSEEAIVDLNKENSNRIESVKVTEENGDTAATESINIKIKSSMTISNNSLYAVNGRDQYLRLKMVSGTYYEDWTPGPYMGTVWKGDFVFELADATGAIITETNLKSVHNEHLIFNSSFLIEFDDYNNDGDIDFTIGQYSSSNGNDYRLFTIRNDGTIEELPVKGQTSIYISVKNGYYSTKLDKIDETTFQVEFYDMIESKYIAKIYTWDGEGFFRN